MFFEHLCGQCGPKIRVVLLDQGQNILALGFVYLVVGGFAARFVADRNSTFCAVGFKQPKHLPLCDIQQVRAVLDVQPSIINLRQNLDTVQLSFAH